MKQSIKIDNELNSIFEQIRSSKKLLKKAKAEKTFNLETESNETLESAKSKTQNLLSKIQKCNITGDPKITLNNDQIHAAASISGILMFCESQGKKNPTFGYLERKAIKNVLSLARKGYSRPFGKTFANKTGKYISAYNTESYMSNPAFEEKGTGGVRQTKMILQSEIKNMFLSADILEDGNIIIQVSDLPDNLREFNTKNLFNSNKLKFDPNPNSKLERSKLKNYNVTELENYLKTSTNERLNQFIILRIYSLQIESKAKDNKISLEDLPDDNNIKFKFNNTIEETPKKFFKKLFEKNMKKLYKLQNRTIPTKCNNIENMP